MESTNKFSSEIPAIGYYVNVDGQVKSLKNAPEGCKFMVEKKESYSNLLVVVKKTGEVLDEYQIWNSIEDMIAAGIDCSDFKED